MCIINKGDMNNDMCERHIVKRCVFRNVNLNLTAGTSLWSRFPSPPVPQRSPAAPTVREDPVRGGCGSELRLQRELRVVLNVQLLVGVV